MSKFLIDNTGRVKKPFLYGVWISFILVSFLFYYSNHYFPKGPMFDTGDVVCLNDGRGPCGEKFIEDPRYLDIPWWGKFFKKSEGELLWMGLLFVGILVSYYGKSED